MKLEIYHLHGEKERLEKRGEDEKFFMYYNGSIFSHYYLLAFCRKDIRASLPPTPNFTPNKMRGRRTIGFYTCLSSSFSSLKVHPEKEEELIL